MLLSVARRCVGAWDRRIDEHADDAVLAQALTVSTRRWRSSRAGGLTIHAEHRRNQHRRRRLASRPRFDPPRPTDYAETVDHRRANRSRQVSGTGVPADFGGHDARVSRLTWCTIPVSGGTIRNSGTRLSGGTHSVFFRESPVRHSAKTRRRGRNNPPAPSGR